jgi:probable HAF family extracellular repeat protein
VAIEASSVGAVTIAEVDFFVDGTPVGSDTDGADGWSVDWDSTQVGDGPRTVHAVATDTASDDHFSELHGVVVNNAGPLEVAQLAPSGRIASETPTLSGVYADASSQDGHLRFEIRRVDTEQLVANLATPTVSSGSEATVVVPPGTLVPGVQYEVRAVGMNTSGSLSRQPISITLEVGEPRGAVYDDDFADPAVVRDGATYYAFATNAGGNNVPVLQSTDLVDWGAPGDAMPLANMGSAVAEFSGSWVLYYSAWHDTLNRHCIGTAVASSPAGPYTDGDGQGTGEIEDEFVCADGDSIDPSVFVDPATGDAHLLWKIDDSSGAALLQARELDTTGRDWAAGSSVVTLLNGDQAWEEDYIEQPEMTFDGNTYRLLYAGNGWQGKNYAIGYAVCASGPAAPCTTKVTDDSVGPWLAARSSDHYPDNLHTTAEGHGPGSASIFEDLNTFSGKGGDWMAYHAWPTEEGWQSEDELDRYRAFHLDKFDIAENGPEPDFFYPLAAAGLTDLGDPGGGESAGKSLTDQGQLVGYAATGPGGELTAASWREDLGWADLGLFTGNETQAEDINESGDVVGTSFTSFGDLSTHRAVRWSGRSNLFQQLPDATQGFGQPAQAIGLNNDGYAVGWSGSGGGDFRPVRWTPWGSVGVLFGDNEVEPGSYLGEAYDINDEGEAVGYYCLYVTCTRRAFIWDPFAGPSNIGNLGADPTIATKINHNSQVVGWSRTAGGETHAFLWDEANGMVDLFAGQTVGNSYALGINDRGQVIGIFYTGPGNTGIRRGFVHDPDWGLADLGDLHPTATTETFAADINNQGIITGWSVNESAEVHAFVRGTGDKVPEP